MTLKAVVENLDSVDEKHKDLYQPERDSDGKDTGRHIVAIEPASGYNLENIEALKGALGKTRTEKDDLSKKLSFFDGIDPKKYKTLEQEVESLRTTDADTEARINKIVESQTHGKLEEAKNHLDAATAEYSTQLEEERSKTSGLEQSLKRVLVSDRAKAIAEGVSDSPHLLAAHIEKLMKPILDEKGPRVVFVDAQGTPRVGKDIHGDMSEAEFIEEIKKSEEFAPLIRGATKPGGGPTPPGGTKGSGGSGPYDPKAPREDRRNAIREKMAQA